MITTYIFKCFLNEN